MKILDCEIATMDNYNPQPSPPNSKLDDERELFVAYWKYRLLKLPFNSIQEEDFLDFIAPSWNLSNGYFEDTYEKVLLDVLLQKYKDTINLPLLNRIVHNINTFTLFVPFYIQVRLIKWILDCNNFPTPADSSSMPAQRNTNSTNLTVK